MRSHADKSIFFSYSALRYCTLGIKWECIFSCCSRTVCNRIFIRYPLGIKNYMIVRLPFGRIKRIIASSMNKGMLLLPGTGNRERESGN